MVTMEEKEAARKALMHAYAVGDMELAGRATAILRAWCAESVDRPVTAAVTLRRRKGHGHASPIP